jgi:hypothetical protein
VIVTFPALVWSSMPIGFSTAAASSLLALLFLTFPLAAPTALESFWEAIPVY